MSDLDYDDQGRILDALLSHDQVELGNVLTSLIFGGAAPQTVGDETMRLILGLGESELTWWSEHSADVTGWKGEWGA